MLYASKQKGEGVFFALRQDAEASGVLRIPKSNVDISLMANGDLWGDERFARQIARNMANTLDEFEAVVTDRLHVAILSALMGKRVCLLKNSYWKNESVYEHSLALFFDNVHFIKNIDRVHASCPELSSLGAQNSSGLLG
jgi:exopolysaccharide biosynthesis predicted pyruvyltransferase EpsI